MSDADKTQFASGRLPAAVDGLAGFVSVVLVLTPSISGLQPIYP